MFRDRRSESALAVLWPPRLRANGRGGRAWRLPRFAGDGPTRWLDRSLRARPRCCARTGPLCRWRIHGNDHCQPRAGPAGRRSRRRTRAWPRPFDGSGRWRRRAGVPVDRVMVPPHERCSEQSLRAMHRLGFDAACISTPHPWRDGESAASPLLGWRPAEFVAGGLPVLPRHSLRHPQEEFVLQGAAGTAADCLRAPRSIWPKAREVLDRAADFVNGLGPGSLGLTGLDRDEPNSRSRQAGDTVVARLCSRRAAVDLPPGASELRAEVGELFGDPGWRGLSATGRS